MSITLTNEERDRMIMETHDAVITILPIVRKHEDDMPVLKKDVTLLQERQEKCPARIAVSIEHKKMGISQVMMAIAIIGIVLTAVVGILNYLK